MELLLRIILIAVACTLIGVISFIVVRYKSLMNRKDTKMGKEEVLGRLFLRKIRQLGEESRGENLREVLKRLNKIMKAFFGELYEIGYEFDYVELNEELGEKGVDEDIRKEIIDYAMKIEETEYGGRQITENDFFSLVEKSADIIRKVTEKKEEPGVEPIKEEVEKIVEAGKAQPLRKEKGGMALRIESILRLSALKRIREKLAAKKEEPEAPKVPQRVAGEAPAGEVPGKGAALRAPAERELPVEHEEEERKVLVPKKDEERVSKIRKLLVAGENSLIEGQAEDAMDKYTELREIYESLSPEHKRGMCPEAKRMIALYNALLKEFKDTLAGAESEKPGKQPR